MNKGNFAAALLAVACAALPVHSAQAQNARSAGTTLSVRVVSGQVQVYPNTRVQVSAAAPSLTFQLQTPGYRMNSGSIDFGDWKSYFRCSASSDGQAVRCTRTNDAASGDVIYTVSVDAETGGTPDQSPPNGVIMLD